MPEAPNPSRRPHPRQVSHRPVTRARGHQVAYAELAVTSNFTFLVGGSHPEEHIQRAAELGYRAIALTDTNTLAGIVRAHVAAQSCGVQLIVGCRLRLSLHELSCDNQHHLDVLVYPTDLAAYGRLCRLLTLGKRRTAKGECHLTLHDLIEHHEGLLAVLVPPRVMDEGYVQIVRGLKQTFDADRLSIGVAVRYQQDDAEHLRQVAALCEHVQLPGALAAINDALYHVPQRQPLQDMLTCIRAGVTIDRAGLRLLPNAERHLKPPEEMARLFADYPQAIERTTEIAERCRDFSLDQLRYQYPAEVVPAGHSPMQHLGELTWAGAAQRYPGGVPNKVQGQITHELKLIDELNYPHYFLTVHDLVMFAQQRNILCQGRGAAANSAVCYCLGVTAVDPERIDVLFERFISKARDEPPDIDIDFEHERREEVIQYIYAKYGRDRAALTAEVITYRARSAVRDVGKALGLSLDAVDRLAKQVDCHRHTPIEPEQLEKVGLQPGSATAQRLQQLTTELIGFPRHLSQHVGGFVLTDKPLCESVPIENAAMADRTVIEWDKDDIDAVGMLKVDVLGLGMLTCLRKCFELVKQHHGADLTLAAVPEDNTNVYAMISNADTIGVFQIESRAQMSMLPRLRPQCFYDLVIEVAIVRPGPIQGDMVHPYLRRRCGEEPIDYPDDTVKQVLGKTLGVPLFQEQAMSLAIHCAGFTPDEADQLRRAMAAWKRKGHLIDRFEKKLIEGMMARGYARRFAQQCFERIRGFSEYGFPESHAASFALLVYVSAWLKHHYPTAYTCALLNSQPMGFYAPAQLVRDAREHGVRVRPVDANCSRWDCTLETDGTLRLGMRQVHGLRKVDAHTIAEAVAQHGSSPTIEALWRHSGVPVAALRRLAEADAYPSMGLDRQQALWHMHTLREADAPLFDQVAARAAVQPEKPQPRLPPVPELRKVIQDYTSIGLSLKQHPMAFLRHHLDAQHVATARQMQDDRQYPSGAPVTVAGLCLLRQRPATGKGVTFMTLEDETGQVNLIVYPDIYQRFRAAAHGATVLLAAGAVQRQGQVVHVMVRRIEDWSAQVADLTAPAREFR